MANKPNNHRSETGMPSKVLTYIESAVAKRKPPAQVEQRITQLIEEPKARDRALTLYRRWASIDPDTV